MREKCSHRFQAATLRSLAVATLLGLGLGLAPTLRAQEPSDQVRSSEGYASATSAFKSKMFAVAARRFAELLASDEAKTFSESDRDWLTAQTAMAHARANQPEAALDALGKLASYAEADFWRAQALVQLGRFDQAEAVMAELLKSEKPVYEDACRYNYARVLVELDRHQEAADEWKKLFASKNPETAARARVAHSETLFKLQRYDEIEFVSSVPEPYQTQLRYIVGLVHLREGNAPKANQIFEEVLRTLSPTSDLRVASEIGLARTCSNLNQQDRAIQILTSSIEKIPGGPLLYECFATLESLDLLSSPDVESRLRAWRQGDNETRAIAAQYYSMVAMESEEEKAVTALAGFSAFVAENPDHVLVPQALLRQAALLAISPRTDGIEEALRVLEKLDTFPLPAETRNVTNFLEAKAKHAIADSTNASATEEQRIFAKEEFHKASTQFLQAAVGADTEAAAVSNYNAAIAAMRADLTGDLTAFVTALDEQPVLKGDFLIERGLYLAASQRYRDAKAELEKLLAFFPRHPRAFDARLALTEIAMLGVETRVREANKQLKLAAQIPGLTEHQQQRLDYTRFWMEESKRSGDRSPAIALGTQFLTNWPASPWNDDVQMKLGEHFFRQGDYPSARRMFEQVASDSEDSELVDAALYFAGKAHIRLNPVEGPDKAIELWHSIVLRGGSLSIPARFQQALVKRRQLKYDEAAEILQELLSNDKVTGEERKAFLCLLGETYFSQSRTLPEKLALAEASFNEVIEQSEDSPSWRNQALYRLAKCYEKSGDTVAAKSAYSLALDSPITPEPDYVWYYRAGFQLIEILKRDDQWDAAIEIADKMAESKGPRAQQADALGNELRLEGFRLKK